MFQESQKGDDEEYALAERNVTVENGEQGALMIQSICGNAGEQPARLERPGRPGFEFVGDEPVLKGMIELLSAHG